MFWVYNFEADVIEDASEDGEAGRVEFPSILLAAEFPDFLRVLHAFAAIEVDRMELASRFKLIGEPEDPPLDIGTREFEEVFLIATSADEFRKSLADRDRRIGLPSGGEGLGAGSHLSSGLERSRDRLG